MAEPETDPRCGNRNPERGRDMVCVRVPNHAGYHRDTIATTALTVRWSATGERCPARMDPKSQFSPPCQLRPDHTGPHENKAQGASWPNPARCAELSPDKSHRCKLSRDHTGPHESGRENGVKWDGENQTNRKPVPSVVLSRIRLHRAETEHALAVAESRLEGQPVLTMAAKRLRLSVTLLRSELEAWTEIERYAGGGS